MPSATTPLVPTGKAAEGEPRVRRPAGRPDLEPLAEGGFVLRRLVALLALSLVVVPAASAARVFVRVEGNTRTIFGPQYAVVNATTAMDALEQASLAGEVYYHVTVTGFRPNLGQEGRYGSARSAG